MDNFKNYLQFNERESLNKKQEFITRCWDELRSLLLENKITIANHFNSPFGSFSGVILNGKPIKDMKNYSMVYYFGDASDLHGAEGKAELTQDGVLKANVICTKIYLSGKYDLFYLSDDFFPDNSLTPLDKISPDIFKNKKLILDKQIPTGEDLLFDISFECKKVLAHELTHVYDLLTHGMKDYNIDKKWHLRHGELEAELISLYDTMKDKIHEFDSVKEFTDKYPLTYDGLSLMVSNYDTLIGSIIRQYELVNDKKTINKIYKRLVEIRQKIIDILNKKS